MSIQVTVRGERDGPVLVLGGDVPAETETLADTLRHYLDAHASFFRGASITLDVGERILSAEALAALVTVAEQFGLRVEALRSRDPETRAAALSLGLRTPFSPEEVTPLSAAVPEGAQPALVVRRTVRSGQSIRFPGTVVVFGDVNPGGEIIAAGDVFVWGRLRGVVHAGASGDESAVVCALELSPTQLRIGSHIARPPEEPRKRRVWFWRPVRQPEMARVQNGTIVVENAL
ncbi:MAG: septum site-determining protein MinC [Ardenticatenia bacterium]|nr:septum site-determining protein MinC [Ardenticatenia bacterium]